MKNRRLLFLMLLTLWLALPVLLAQAQEGASGVVFTDHYVLREGQRVEGDLVVVAQTVTLQHGSQVTGNVALLGENITLNGQVHGDLAVLGESVVLGSGMYVVGNVTLCGGAIHRESNVNVVGDYSASCDRVRVLLGDIAPVALDLSQWKWDNFDPADWDWGLLNRIPARIPEMSPADWLGRNVLLSLGMGALAALITLVMPLRLRRVSDAALTAPVTMGIIGVLTLVVLGAVSALVVLSLVLIVTACLLPFLGLAWLALLLMALIGWTALSLPIGAWLLAAMDVRRVSPLAAALGALVLTFLPGLLNLSAATRPVYYLLLLALGAWGLGATIMTGLGRQAYARHAGRWAGASRRM